MVLGLLQIFPAPFGYKPHVIEEQKRKSDIGSFEVAAIKADSAVNNDAANNCELNYRECLFHILIP